MLILEYFRMINFDLEEIAKRESEQIEWKENVADVENVVQTLVAFANDFSNLGGGYVVCGAKETKDEYGFPKLVKVGLTSRRIKELEGKILSLCRDYVSPPIVPIIQELPSDVQDNRLLIFVMPATNTAHSFRSKEDTGKYYIRMSRETREARNGLLRQLLVRKGSLEPFDRRICQTATIADLDLIALRDALQRMKYFDANFGLDDFLKEDRALSPLVPSLCAREALTGILRPRNFAILLFGREPQNFIAGSYSIFSIYPGEDRSEVNAERHELTGNLIAQSGRLIELLNVQAYTKFDKSDIIAPNALKYPRRALNEAIVNALVHRDYELVDPNRVTVFSNRIEILSFGSLPDGIQPSEFQEGKASPRWRNQSLAWFMMKLQLAQAEGQGIPTILRTMREEGCPPPEFDLNDTRVLCRLPAHPRHALMRDVSKIEASIAVGDIQEAKLKLIGLIKKDTLNYRVVQLFAEVQQILKDPLPILEFLENNQSQLASFNAVTVMSLVDAILTDINPNIMWVQRLLTLASQQRLEIQEVRQIALGYFKLKKPLEALLFLESALAEHSIWYQNAAILQLRGRAFLELAKKCYHNSRDRNLPNNTRNRAKDESVKYLNKAERDFQDALIYQPNLTIEALVQESLSQIKDLKNRR
jgi:predicted HTH transcriptional regulator